jgi:hypothetical protein
MRPLSLSLFGLLIGVSMVSCGEPPAQRPDGRLSENTSGTAAVQSLANDAKGSSPSAALAKPIPPNNLLPASTDPQKNAEVRGKGSQPVSQAAGNSTGTQTVATVYDRESAITFSATRGGHTIMVSDELPFGELKQALTDVQDPAQKALLLRAMVDRGEAEPVTPILMKALNDSDQRVRETALSLLKESFEPLPLEHLASMASSDANPELRIEALTMLTDQLFSGSLKPESWSIANATLNQGLSDPNPAVSEHATSLLPRLVDAVQPVRSGWSH